MISIGNAARIASWGSETQGGELFDHTPDLEGVQQVVMASMGGYAALKSDGSVTGWGGRLEVPYEDKIGDLASGVVSISANSYSFAALKADGSVVTWGTFEGGGDSSAVAAQLEGGVVEISATFSAFAALKADGSVVTWGNANSGGDSSAVASSLAGGVTSIRAGTSGFVALKTDGSVSMWGGSQVMPPALVAAQLSSEVAKIETDGSSFAALKNDGSVVVWGYEKNSDFPVSCLIGVADLSLSGLGLVVWKLDGSVVASNGVRFLGYPEIAAPSGPVHDVVKVVASENANALLLEDGSVISWGLISNGGDSSGVAGGVSGGVVDVKSTGRAFAALKQDGSVVAWGDPEYGGDTSSNPSLDSGVESITASTTSFTARKSDGSLVVWGWPATEDQASVFSDIRATSVLAAGGTFFATTVDGPVVTYGRRDAILDGANSGFARIIPGYNGFAAIRDNGSAVSWGLASTSDSTSVRPLLSAGVVDVIINRGAMAALKEDGSVVTWGRPGWGGDGSAVSAELEEGVDCVVAGYAAFAAIKDDTSVVAWGHPESGGDMSAVAAKLTSGVVDVVATRSDRHVINYARVGYGGAFAALKFDGSVVCWGSAAYGGNPDDPTGYLSSGVVSVHADGGGFVALKTDGSVIRWASSQTQYVASGASRFFPAAGSGLCMKSDGLYRLPVSSYTDPVFPAETVTGEVQKAMTVRFDSSFLVSVLTSGGSVLTTVPTDFPNGVLESGVSELVSNLYSLAALKGDGSVATWGRAFDGGDSSEVSSDLASGIVSVAATLFGFGALDDHGKVVTWGQLEEPTVPEEADAAIALYANDFSFAVLLPEIPEVTVADVDVGAGKLALCLSSLSVGGRYHVAVSADMDAWITVPDSGFVADSPTKRLDVSFDSFADARFFRVHVGNPPP